MKENSSRVFSINRQIRNIYLGAKGFVLLKTSRKYKLMNKKLKERIMLAITEVNGCEMCSYMHTKLALSAGMSAENIKMILDGNIENIPEDEAVAVMFAQYFAFSKENPSDDTLDEIVKTYGFKKAELIIAACNMITMTNGMGTSMDYLYKRIRFKRYRKSNILVEILNPLFTMILFPTLVLFFYFTMLFRTPQVLNKRYAFQGN